jgi:hypothetical protein
VRVFVSYRREDASGHAGRLYDLLAAHYGPEHVFMDIDAIPLGSEFRAAIDRAVSSCDVLIALIGRGWVGAADSAGRRRLDDPDDFVRREIESALAHEVVVVPTCVQGAAMPSPDELPASLAPLAGRQGFDLRDAAWQDDVGRLVRRLEHAAAGQPGGSAPPRPTAKRRARTKPWSRRRRTLVAALGLLALAVVAIAVAGSGGGGGGSDGADEGPSTSAERRLLAMIPEGTRPDCQRTSSPDPRAEASLSCGVASFLTADYLLFPNKSVAHQWYTQARISEDVDPDEGDCTAAKFRGETDYISAGRDAGRYFCFIADGMPALGALDERANVGIGVGVYGGKGQAAVRRLMELWDCCIPLVLSRSSS